MNKVLKKSIAVILCVLTVMPFMLTSALGATLIDDSLLVYKDKFVTGEKAYRVTNGITEKHIVLNNGEGSKQVRNFVIEVDSNNSDLSIITGYNDGDGDGWGMATLPDQVKAMEKKRGVKVVAAVNGGDYSTRTGEPVDIVIMNGEEIHAASGHSFFAILKDGTPVIRRPGGRTDDVKEAIASMYHIIENGKVIYNYDKTLHPRTAVGIKADGTVVFMVSDGRQSPDSCGMTIDEQADTMYALGCVDALSLDGGGSSTFMTQRECFSDLSVKNSPCYGFNRPIGTSLMICSTAEPTNYFDHISFSESEYAVHPGESIKIEYKSCDINGFEFKTESKGKLVVEDPSYGTVIGNRFFAKKKQGTVKLNYVLDNYVVASVNVIVTDTVDDFIIAGLKNFLQSILDFIQLVDFVMSKLKSKLGI